MGLKNLDFGEKTYEGIWASVGLGLAVFEECGLAEMIDKAVGYTGGRKLSPGYAVKALLGPMFFISKKIAVCRIDDFYRSAPVDVLFGDDVGHRSLNDRALGEVLDILSGTDLQDLLWRCAERCRGRFGLISWVFHMDATNFPVYVLTGIENPEEGAVVPMYGGNSKIGRNDLRQYDAEVVTDGNRTVTYMRAYSGNTSDSEMNRDTIEFLKGRLDCKRSTVVADCKLVNAELVGELIRSDIGFISKCPENFSDKVKDAIVYSVEHSSMDRSSLGEGYAFYDTEADTELGRLRFVAYRTPNDKVKSVEYHREQGERLIERAFGPLRRRRYNCIPDAESDFMRVCSSLEEHGYVVWHKIVRYEHLAKREGRGRPKKGSPPPETVVEYGIEVSWEFDESAAKKLAKEDGIQVLITNLPYSYRGGGNLRDGATSDEVIRTYLNEYKAEHTFRLLKSGLGMSKVYLHKPSREVAMMVVLGFAALITSVIDCVLRDADAGYTFNDMSWEMIGTTVRYRRPSGYRFLDGPEGSGKQLKEYCEILNIDPNLMIGRK